MMAFPCRNIAAHWQIAVLPLYLPPLNSLDYRTGVVSHAKGNAPANPNVCSLKQTIQQECDRKVWQCCGKIAVCSGSAWQRSSLLAVAMVISSQEISLQIIEKNFWALNYEIKKFLNINVKNLSYCTELPNT
jgi:hypothetical protein